MMIDILNLQVSAENKEILKGVNLQINDGEIHAMMGPNGSGKSTLASVVAGSGEYLVKSGKAVWKGNLESSGKSGRSTKNLFEMTPDERAKNGIFMSFQNPVVIAGVEVGKFLRQIYLVGNQGKLGVKKGRGNRGNQQKKVLSLGEFRIWVFKLMTRLDLKPEIFQANLNETMSGGEKKKLEILQMMILAPRFVILDEIDSGLDIDALKTICREINLFIKENPKTSFLIISHYNRIFKYIKPDYVHVMKNGRIVKNGGSKLVEEVEKGGYVSL